MIPLALGAALLLFSPLVLAADASDAPAAAPVMAPPIDMVGASMQVAGYLILLIALLALAARLARRWQPGLGVGPVRLLGGLNLTPGTGVRLIQVGERIWLVGVSRERITPIAELKREDLPAVAEKKP